MKEGWVYKKLGDCFTSINNGANIKQIKGAGGLPITRIETISNDIFNRDRLGYADISSKETFKKYQLNDGDILMSHINSMKFLGRSVVYKKKDDEYIIHGMNLLRLVPKCDCFSVFMAYLFMSPSFREQLLTISHQSVNQASFNITALKGLVIPVPSLSDQQRIVSYLDAEFAKIEALKANAEKQLQAAKDLFQAALKELLTPKEGWEEKKLGDLCSICGEYGLNESATDYNGVRYLRITDITDDGELNNDKVSAKNNNKKIQEELEVGDILFARTGATVGKTLVYRKEFGKCVFAGNLIRYRTNPNIILPQFLFYYTHSTKYYDWVKNNQAAAAQPNISAQKYNCLIIAFPKDTAEQQRIADRLDALSANVKALQTNYTETITLCNDLKQALLKKVFEEDG